MSATVAPGAVLGPALVTTMVYVTGPPAVTDVTPLVLVTPRSAVGVRASVSVAVASSGVGSGTSVRAEAVLARVPVAAGSIMAITVYTARPPTGRLITSLMLPVPVRAPAAPPVKTATQVTLPRMAAKLSTTVTASTGSGPALVTTIV